MSEFRDKLLSLSVRRGRHGGKKVTVIDRRDTGNEHAIITEHWHDRQDVHIIPPTVNVGSKVNGEE